jgi:hypothetical protein
MATDQMTNPLAVALMGKDAIAQQEAIRQQRAYADMMRAQSMKEPQGQMVSGHYIAPSITSNLARMLQVYAAKSTEDALPDQMSNAANAALQSSASAFGLGGATPQAMSQALAEQSQQSQPMQSQPNAQSMPQSMPIDASNGGNAPAAGQQAQMPQQFAPVQNSPRMPIPAGMDNKTAFMLYNMNPQVYANALKEYGAPTELQKKMNAAGIDPRSHAGQQYIRANLAKENYIAPVSAAPGATMLDPYTNRPFFNAPKDGIQMGFNPDGTAVAGQVQGYAQANAGIAGAEEGAKSAAKAQFTPDTMVNSNGDTVATNQLVTSGNAPQMGANGQNNGQGVIKAINPVSIDSQKGLNDSWTKNTLQTVLNNGESAQQAIDAIRAMRTIPLDTGWGAQTQASAANFLGKLGIPEAEKYAGNVQKFQSVAMDRLQSALAQQKGPQTEGDAQRAAAAFASVANTPAANAFIQDFAEAKAIRDMKKKEFYERATQFDGIHNNLRRIDTEWNKAERSIFDYGNMKQYLPKEKK